MARMSGGEALVEALETNGVNQMFGLLGSSTMEVYDALFERKGFSYIGVRDERSGVHMADAYGRVTGRCGVILAGQAGPGAANLTTGLAQAYLAYSPVVAITGLVSSEHLGRDAFQEIDQQSLFAPITKRTLTVPRADRIPEYIKEACRIATSGRHGPVVLNIARDLFSQQIETAPEASGPASPMVATTVDQATLARICELIRAAKAPAIVAGGGIKAGRSWPAVIALADLLQIPIVASAGHGDVIPSDHPLFFGQMGPRGNPVASAITREADLLLALGTRLGFNSTFYTYSDLSRDAAIVQIDIDPIAVARYFPVSIGAPADAGAVASTLTEAFRLAPVTTPAWQTGVRRYQQRRDELWSEREAAGSTSRTPLSAEHVFGELRKALPRDAIVTLDAGTMCLQATDQLRYHEPPALLTPLDFGLVGFSYAAGLGAKVAAPNRPVVSLMGDGGFALNMAEITTAVQHGIAAVAMVLDNGCWGAEKAYQRDFFNGRFIGSDVLSPPYDKVAELCGARGYAVDQPGTLSGALREALAANEPAVIHVKVDPDAIVSFRRDSFKHRAAR